MWLISYAKMSYFQSTLIMKKLFPVLLILLIGGRAAAQSDTLLVLLDDNDKPTKNKNAPRYGLIHRDHNQWKKVVFDAFDDKPIWGAYFSDAACKNQEGPYTRFHKNGKIRESGKYINNKKEGPWKAYSDEGRLTDSAFYTGGLIKGLALSWYDDGTPSDSLFFDEAGKGTGRSYNKDGSLRETGAYLDGKKEGPWTYYHFKGGYKSQDVIYKADSAISYTCYDDEGKLQTKDCIYEKEAVFKGGDKAWRTYLERRLGSANYPSAFQKGQISGVIIIQFVVNSDGKIIDVKALNSIHPEMDQIAMSIIKDSPKWEPAVQYNRKVKAYRKQPITFATRPSE